MAHRADAKVLHDVDDLGPFRYFDLMVSHEDGSAQLVRFASHDADSMVHLLAEEIDATSDIAAALVAVGIDETARLSISTDLTGQPLRSEDEIRKSIAETIDRNVPVIEWREDELQEVPEWNYAHVGKVSNRKH